MADCTPRFFFCYSTPFLYQFEKNPYFLNKKIYSYHFFFRQLSKPLANYGNANNYVMANFNRDLDYSLQSSC